MANLVFKRSTVTSLKVAGLIDTDKMNVDVDGEEKDIKTLFSPFNGSEVEITIKVKAEEELDEPANE